MSNDIESINKRIDHLTGVVYSMMNTMLNQAKLMKLTTHEEIIRRIEEDKYMMINLLKSEHGLAFMKEHNVSFDVDEAIKGIETFYLINKAEFVKRELEFIKKL